MSTLPAGILSYVLDVLPPTGGVATEPGDGYRYHTFTTNGVFDPRGSSLSTEYLVVGSSGQYAAGSYYASGGAGGCVRIGTTTILTTQAITVGAGGANSGAGNAGVASSIGSLVTAPGGGTSPSPRVGGSNADFTGQSGLGGTDSGGGAGAGENGAVDGTGQGGDGVEWPAGSGNRSYRR